MSTPGIYIETYGCSFNVSDGEVMAGVLARAGYRIVSSLTQADVLIVNTCTVKDRTYREFVKRFRELKEQAGRDGHPRLIVAGCIPKVYERTGLLAGVSRLGPDTLDQLAEVVRETLAGRVAQRLRQSGPDRPIGRPLLPVRRKHPTIEILPIACGCLSVCAFCQTRLARGRLRSFRPGDIVRRARQALDEGARELWLTAQDTGAYGKDCDYPLPRLLRQLCDLEGDFRIRLGMSSPCWIRESLTEYLEVLGHPKMFSFLHAPVQSGSDRILRAMKRGNTGAHFIEIAEAFHERLPEGALMTDIIVGFPGETEEDFAATLALLERVRPAAVNRSKFSSRPGTAAAGMKPLPGLVVAERSRRLMEAAARLARSWNERWVGRCDRVLTSQIKKDTTVVAHNQAYRPVILPGQWPLGEWLEVEYNGAADYHLYARPLSSVSA